MNKVDEHGWTALMFAARNGQCDAIRALMAAGYVMKNV